MALRRLPVPTLVNLNRAVQNAFPSLRKTTV